MSCALVVVVALVPASAGASTTNGTVHQLGGIAGCITDDGSGGVCTDGSVNGTEIQAVAISPDGTSVYAAANDAGILIFDRQTSGGTDYGKLTQKPGAAGCINDDGSHGCTDGRELTGVTDIKVSPDGLSVYVASVYLGHDIATFDRDASGGASNGELTQKIGTLGCLNDGGARGCGATHDMEGPLALAVSRDGMSVYAASNNGSITVYDRAPDGSIVQKAAQLGCVSDSGSAGACADGTAIDGGLSIAMSPDDLSVYVGSYDDDSLAVFDRDASGLATNGQITQKAGTAGCISATTTGGLCALGNSMGHILSVAASPDGRSVYATTSGVDVFDRDTSPGATHGQLTQKPGADGCLRDPRFPACTPARAIGSEAIAITPDGTSVYVSSASGDFVVLDRDTSGGANNGKLAQKTGLNGCFTDDGSDGVGGTCRTARGLSSGTGFPHSLVVSPNGRSLYVPSGTPGIVVFARTISKPFPCSIEQPTTRGTKGNDSMKGTAGDDIVSGGDGNDTIFGGTGYDVICGGSGRDTLRGGAGKDLLNGEAGVDRCFGGPDADIVKSC